MIPLNLLFYSLVGGLFSLIGGLLLLIHPSLTQRLMTPLIAFGAGAFLGAAFLDILPEALEVTPEPHPILFFTLAGFVLFFTLERFIMRYLRGHPNHGVHSDHTESLPVLLISGDTFHNFLDGIVIALAFSADPLLGLPTALAIAAHEIPQEIGDFAVLLRVGWKKLTVIGVNVVQSLVTIPGVVLGYSLGQRLEGFLPQSLGIAAGIFLYIAASDLVPEIHHRAGHKAFWSVVIPTILGITTLWFLSNLAHG